MSETTTSIGRVGEAVAAEFLLSKGYEILTTNYSRPYGEIDLVVRGDVLVLIEVKSIRCRIPEELPAEGDNTHRPEENVGRDKRRRLRRITETYLSKEVEGDPVWRFDLICVYLDEGSERARVKWLQNIII